MQAWSRLYWSYSNQLECNTQEAGFCRHLWTPSWRSGNLEARKFTSLPDWKTNPLYKISCLYLQSQAALELSDFCTLRRILKYKPLLNKLNWYSLWRNQWSSFERSKKILSHWIAEQQIQSGRGCMLLRHLGESVCRALHEYLLQLHSTWLRRPLSVIQFDRSVTLAQRFPSQ